MSRIRDANLPVFVLSLHKQFLRNKVLLQLPVEQRLYYVGNKKRTILIKGKKGKVHPRTSHESLEGEQIHSYTLSLTLALDGVGGQPHAPAALPPGKTRYPWYGRLVGSQGRAGRVRKISVPPGLDPGLFSL
jgi:hypothetical protein